jgi:hypothetical protein
MQLLSIPMLPLRYPPLLPPPLLLRGQEQMLQVLGHSWL